VLKNKCLPYFQRILELFIPKIVTKLSNIWVRDPGSEIRDPEKTYSGIRKKPIPDPGSMSKKCTRSRINTGIIRSTHSLGAEGVGG